MHKLPLILVPLLLAWAMTSSGSLARPQDHAQQQQSQPTDAYLIPVGAVILWWGMESDLPPGFEVCDGKSPITKGAILKDRKPDLRDRFAKGAKDFSSFRPLNAATGGTNARGDLTTEPHVLALNEIPQHTHTIAHTHTLAQHAHRLGSHTHSIGEFVSIQFTAGPAAATLLQQSPGGPAMAEAPGPGQMTGTSDVLTTSEPSMTHSGMNVLPGGRLQGHTHVVRGGDALPAFLEMIWIIRVK